MKIIRHKTKLAKKEQAAADEAVFGKRTISSKSNTKQTPSTKGSEKYNLDSLPQSAKSGDKDSKNNSKNTSRESLTPLPRKESTVNVKPMKKQTKSSKPFAGFKE
jgi:hypothetical protein